MPTAASRRAANGAARLALSDSAQPQRLPVRIRLTDMRVTMSIGLLCHERVTPQTVQFQLECEVGHCPACQSDRIDGTVDYRDLADAIRNQCATRHFDLLENLVELAATTLLQRFPLTWVRIEAQKQDVVDGVATVAVMVERRAGKVAWEADPAEAGNRKGEARASLTRFPPA